MAVVPPEHAYHVMRTQGLMYWTLRERPQGGVIQRYMRPDGNIEDSINELQDTLHRIEGDYVHLSLRDKTSREIREGDKNTGHYPNIKIKLPNNAYNRPAAPAAIAAPAQGISIEKYLDEVRKATDAQHALELERIARKNAEPPEPSIGERVIEKLVEHPAFDTLITGLANALIPAAPAAPAAPAITGDEAQAMLTEALNKIAKVDTDYVRTLSKLADHLTKHPELLPTVKQVIGA